MGKNELYIQHRYAARDVGRAIIGAMEWLGRADTVWIVKAPRGEYVCVATPAPWGQIKTPRCDNYLWVFQDCGTGPTRRLQINFGPDVLPERKEQTCRESAS